MKRYALSDLLKRWEREEMTVEQAVGQIILWLISLAERIEKLEIRQRRSDTG